MMKGLSFEVWMARFDKALVERFGVGSEWFPDWGYWDSWNAGDTIEEALEDWFADQEQNY